ncbi:GspE/PulE family protein [Geopseudomonas aromaticivorans]
MTAILNAQKPLLSDTLLGEWGWSAAAPTHVRDIADQILAINPDGTRRIGDIIVDLGLLTREQIESRLPERQPAELLLAFLVRVFPKLQVSRPQIMAIKNHLPFYPRIPAELMVHPLLSTNGALREYCDSLDALLVLIENTQPCLLFADHAELIRYRQRGQIERQRDVILRSLTDEAGTRVGMEDLRFGFANRGDIQAPLRALKSSDGALSEKSSTGKLYFQERNRGEERRVAIDMLEEGIQRAASDLSLRVLDTGEGEIHYRVNSLRLHSYKISLSERIAVCNFLLQSSGAQSSGTNLMKPETGRIFYGGNTGTFEMRCSFIPGSSRDSVNEDDQRLSVSMRYLPQDDGDGTVDIDRLGFEDEVKRHLISALNVKHGILLLVGPTNSGKSTTLAAFLSQHYLLHGDKVKRLSLEDPKERTIKGVEQFSLPAADVYTPYLEGFLRHDPDVILLSEIRSAVSAEVATRAALTGHLVLSTFHASSPIEGYSGLAHLMSSDRQYDLLQSLVMIITQRLMPRLCSKCKVKRPPRETELSNFQYSMRLLGRDPDSLGIDMNDVYFPSDDGCDHCSNSGYRGLVPVHGILDFTKPVRQLLMKEQFEEAEKLQAFTLEEQALKALRRGDISIAEACL